MNDRTRRDSLNNGGQKFELLERLTAVVLALVSLSLVWMSLAAAGFAWVRLSSLDFELGIVIGLVSGALVLVSLLALLQTRG